MDKEPRLLPLVTASALTLGVGIILSSFAFSRKVRAEILARDHTCTMPPPHEGILEAAHYNHDKSNPNYDTAENGRILCTKHHALDHIQHQTENGLAVAGNVWAINKIVNRLLALRGL